MYTFSNLLMFTSGTYCSGSDFEQEYESTSISQDSIIESDTGFR